MGGDSNEEIEVKHMVQGLARGECSHNVGFCSCLNVSRWKALGSEEGIFWEIDMVVHSSLESFSSLEKALIFLCDSYATFLKGWNWISLDK